MIDAAGDDVRLSDIRGRLVCTACGRRGADVRPDHPMYQEPGSVDGMDEGIARANIKHFKTVLSTETDAAKRKVLLELLAEEERKLAAALGRKRKKV